MLQLCRAPMWDQKVHLLNLYCRMNVGPLVMVPLSGGVESEQEKGGGGELERP